jgi:cytochrome c-type biogenesis protein CcmH
MTFWFIAAAMALMVAAFLGRALLRGAGAALPARGSSDIAVYRDQLAGVERDLARGVVAEAEAERLRTEIARRILAADRAAQDDGPVRAGGIGRALPIAACTALVAGSLALYAALGSPGYGDMALSDRIAFAESNRANRASQEEAEARMPATAPVEGVGPAYLTLVKRLREAVEERPDDLQGHVLLAENEARLGNYAAAARAQEQVLRLKGAGASAADLGDHAELLIMAAGGYVSPQAERALDGVLAMDREDGRARYFTGLMMAQNGRPDIAFRLWEALLRRGPADAPWIAPIRAQIPALATLAGVDYQLPPLPQGGPGPSEADVAAAAEMSEDDRAAMIGGMVEGLEARLAGQGGTPQDWARLITSLGVLGRQDRAQAIHDEALQVFAGDATALEAIRAAGAQAGVAE